MYLSNTKGTLEPNPHQRSNRCIFNLLDSNIHSAEFLGNIFPGLVLLRTKKPISVLFVAEIRGFDISKGFVF